MPLSIKGELQEPTDVVCEPCQLDRASQNIFAELMIPNEMAQAPSS